MKAYRRLCEMGIILLLAVVLNACALAPGGIAPSTTPLEGRKYHNLGPAYGKDSRFYLLGIIPITSANRTREAVNEAIASKNADALINVTVESSYQNWLVVSRYVTIVTGDAIKFLP